MTIGEKVARFQPFVDRMPNAWTTVYKLALLENHEFDRVTKSELFTPLMTAGDVNLIVNGKPETKEEGHRDLTIDLSGLERSAKIELYRKVKALEEKFKFRLTLSAELKSVTNNVVTTAA
jgi:hypothetical protein